jgi:chitinase
VNLYKRIMLLKQRGPKLKVYIAIGGWAFNDPGATATTFSDLAASVPRQRVFLESLLSFMSTYGFDGIDVDW